MIRLGSEPSFAATDIVDRYAGEANVSFVLRSYYFQEEMCEPGRIEQEARRRLQNGHFVV